jgi:hypothetical protein
MSWSLLSRRDAQRAVRSSVRRAAGRGQRRCARAEPGAGGPSIALCCACAGGSPVWHRVSEPPWPMCVSARALPHLQAFQMASFSSSAEKPKDRGRWSVVAHAGACRRIPYGGFDKKFSESDGIEVQAPALDGNPAGRGRTAKRAMIAPIPHGWLAQALRVLRMDGSRKHCAIYVPAVRIPRRFDTVAGESAFFASHHFSC